ncbi:MAG: dephospho-CoA kinase [Lachnospiraceae bacterium]|nr:dephospho-CoA kinase [Lachnospiraceae bacterium]
MVIGLTGGIGAGKSLIRDFFENEFGAYCIDMDTLAKDILLEENAKKQIIKAFGKESYLPDGLPDRAYLAKEVFSDIDKRDKINSIIHPLVLSKVKELIAAYEKDHEYVVCESALPVEAKLKEYCDLIIFVNADEEVRRKRLKDSRGYSDEKIDSIFRSQKDTAFYENYADYTLDNSKEPDDALVNLRKILEKGVKSNG